MIRRARIPVTRRWGVALAVGAATISGLSFVVNAAAVRQLPDPAVYTTLKNGVAAIALVVLAGLASGPRATRDLDRRTWVRLALVGIVGGSVPFLLFFAGLAQATAPSAAFIQKTLFVWVALLAVPFLGERLGWAQLAALGVLLAGQALVAPPIGLAWGGGETLIAAATLLWAVEVVLAKRLLARVGSPIVAAGRLGLGLIVLVAYVVMTGRAGIVADLGPAQWVMVIVTGVVLAAYVATWFAALRRAPASLVTAVLVLGAPITAIAQGLARGSMPDTPVLAGGLLVVVASTGLVVLSGDSRRTPAGRESGRATG